MALLRVLAILQAMFLLPIMARFLILPPDFSAIGLWFFAIGVGVVSMPYAIWQFIRHPARRVWAAVMILLAVLTIGLPLLMAQVDLEPLPISLAALSAVILALIASIWLLARPSLWSPDGWGVGRFNNFLLITQLVWIVLVATPLVYGLSIGFAPPFGNEREGLSLDVLLFHAASVSAVGTLLAVFALLFSLVGLRKNQQRALIHGAQLISALVLLALLAIQAALLSIMMVNPG